MILTDVIAKDAQHLPAMLGCSYCYNNAELEEYKQILTLKNEKEIEVDCLHYKCYHCNDEFTTTESDTVTMNRVNKYL